MQKSPERKYQCILNLTISDQLEPHPSTQDRSRSSLNILQMKKALMSKNIVLNDPHSKAPICGIILIEGDFIKDIVQVEESNYPSQLMDDYCEWNPTDYSHYAISPGLIDINVRKQFESYQSLTKAAISGGVTLLIQSTPYYANQEQIQQADLYCDIGKITAADPSKNINSYSSSDIFGLYVSLFKPSPSYPNLVPNLSQYFQQAQRSGMTLFINPTLPFERMFHISSPLHNQPFPKRCNKPRVIQSINIFAAAIPQDIVGSESDNSDTSPIHNKKSVKQTKPVLKGSLNKKFLGIIQQQIKQNQGGFFSLDSSSSQNFQKQHSRTHKDQVIKKLNRRIKKNNGNMSSISLAEIETYQYRAGAQSLPCTSGSDMDTTSDISPIMTSPLSARFRPPPIITKLQSQSTLKPNYRLHLANSPDTWEISGIQKVLQSLEQSSCRVHFQNISSARAVNEIRKAKEKFPLISTELTATNIFFNSEKIKENETRFKNYPVVRGTENQELLMELLKVGSVNCISSGHSSIPKAYKAMDSGNFQYALNGVNCLGFTLQALWNEIYQNSTEAEKQNLVKLARWTSLGPSQVLGIHNKRGSIQKEKLADLVVWDPNECTCINNTFSDNKETNVFISHQIRGKVKAVYLRGRLAFDEGIFYNCGRRVSKEI